MDTAGEFSHPPENQIDDIIALGDAQIPLDERVKLARKIFPEQRKRELLSGADKDKFGRPVSYFRQMSYEELNALLHAEVLAGNSKPTGEAKFASKEDTLKGKLRDLVRRLDSQASAQISDELEEVLSNFTWNGYIQFIQTRIPRVALFELHATDSDALEGLFSLSAGAPILPPIDPIPQDPQYAAGIPIVQFAIPSESVYVHPLTTSTPQREMEKEVNTTELRPEWIIDVYQGEDDFADRFIQQPNSPLYTYWGKDKDSHGNSRPAYDPFSTLFDWKATESLEDYIPVNKLPELDPNNPILSTPLREK